VVSEQGPGGPGYKKLKLGMVRLESLSKPNGWSHRVAVKFVVTE